MSWVQVKLKLPVQSGVFWMSRMPDRSTKQPAAFGGLGGFGAQAGVARRARNEGQESSYFR